MEEGRRREGGERSSICEAKTKTMVVVVVMDYRKRYCIGGQIVAQHPRPCSAIYEGKDSMDVNVVNLESTSISEFHGGGGAEPAVKESGEKEWSKAPAHRFLDTQSVDISCMMDRQVFW